VFDEASSSTASAKSKNKNKNKNKKKKKKKGNLAAIPEEDEESLSDREIREIVQMPIEIDPEVRAAAGSARNKSQDEEEDPDKTPTGPKATPDWGKIPDFKWYPWRQATVSSRGIQLRGRGRKDPKTRLDPDRGITAIAHGSTDGSSLRPNPSVSGREAWARIVAFRSRLVPSRSIFDDFSPTLYRFAAAFATVREQSGAIRLASIRGLRSGRLARDRIRHGHDEDTGCSIDVDA
jgi:hypothetical protein